ncbi:SGNH/GDSL hydrolase family protein [Streptomyces humidus]|nr:SGNH/GDSL hydrolase family protein [Streptomyces humidus]
MKGADFKDLSCTGAKIPDLTSPQSTDDGTNPAQLTALSAETRLVTLGIGGNDIGFASLIKRCVTMGVAYQAQGSGRHISEDAPCERQYVSITDGTDKVRGKIEQTGEKLSATLKEVARRAPQAEIYVVGYPAILPSDGTECGRELPIAPGDVTYLREKEEQLNAMLKQRAEAAGTHYVDTYTPFEGHDACADAGTRWIEPLLDDDAAAVHPNGRGERAMADAVVHTLATSK